MNICMIGGTGHIGGHLVPMLVEAGHQVTVVTSGRTMVPAGASWKQVKLVTAKYERGDPGWSAFMRDLAPRVLIDILGTDLPATYESVKGGCQQLIATGSIWMWGEPRVVPTPEQVQQPFPWPSYSIRMPELLDVKQKAAADGVPFTAIMPPNIAGPGKIPTEGRGTRSIEVHRSHQRGDPVPLPAPGHGLLSPCDAADIARGFLLAVQNRDSAAGHMFNVGPAHALTFKQVIRVYEEIYEVKIPIEWCSWEHFTAEICPAPKRAFIFLAPMCPDITKIRSTLGFEPRHTPKQALERGVTWMKEKGLV